MSAHDAQTLPWPKIAPATLQGSCKASSDDRGLFVCFSFRFPGCQVKRQDKLRHMLKRRVTHADTAVPQQAPPSFLQKKGLLGNKGKGPIGG